MITVEGVERPEEVVVVFEGKPDGDEFFPEYWGWQHNLKTYAGVKNVRNFSVHESEKRKPYLFNHSSEKKTESLDANIIFTSLYALNLYPALREQVNESYSVVVVPLGTALHPSQSGDLEAWIDNEHLDPMVVVEHPARIRPEAKNKDRRRSALAEVSCAVVGLFEPDYGLSELDRHGIRYLVNGAKRFEKFHHGDFSPKD